MTVSIIVRTKDRNLLLRRAIQSIIDQTYNDWEIIVVNNGGDFEQLKASINDFERGLGEKMKLIHMERAQFMEAATNAGLFNSTGKFITLLDDDDTWDRRYLEQCVSILDHTEARAVATQTSLVYEEINGSTTRVIETRPFNPQLNKVNKYKLLRANLYTTNAFMYKREILERIGYYREDLPVLGDWEFNLRVAMHYNVQVIPVSLAFYHKRSYSGNVSSYGNTHVNDHLEYDKKIRGEYLRKGLRGEIPFLIGALIYIFGYVNGTVRAIKKMLKVR